MITYAVVGRDVAPLLAVALEQALEAAELGDKVVYVNSGGGEPEASVARALGVPVLDAPVGKGAAVARLLASYDGGPLCLLDGDIEFSSANIAIALRDAWRREPVELLVADFEWPSRRELRSTDRIHNPFLAFFWPDRECRLGGTPLSGFRMIATDRDLGTLPAGYGLEGHFNSHLMASGASIAAVHVGVYEGPVVRRGSDVIAEIGTAILDVAQAHGRLAAELRPEWDAWLAEATAVFDGVRPDETDLTVHHERLRVATSRPFPAAQPGGVVGARR